MSEGCKNDFYSLSAHKLKRWNKITVTCDYNYRSDQFAQCQTGHI